MSCTADIFNSTQRLFFPSSSIPEAVFSLLFKALYEEFAIISDLLSSVIRDKLVLYGVVTTVI